VKVTLVGGAGGVGASTSFNLVLMRGGHEIVLVDNRPEMITSHLMDLEQALELSPGCSVRGGELSDVQDADVVVLLSSTPLTVGTARLEYLAKNALIADELADELAKGCAGVIVVVTNPVDPLVTRLQQRTGLDRRRILGYTINDSLRLRTGLTHALGVPPGSVEAWVVGEHGDLSVPLEGERVGLLRRGQPLPLGPELELAHAAEMAAVARALEASERGGRLLVDRLVVDVDHAGVQPLGEIGSPGLTPGLDCRRQPVVRRVRQLDGLRVGPERRDRGDRPEDLLLEGRHLRQHVA